MDINNIAPIIYEYQYERKAREFFTQMCQVPSILQSAETVDAACAELMQCCEDALQVLLSNPYQMEVTGLYNTFHGRFTLLPEKTVYSQMFSILWRVLDVLFCGNDYDKGVDVTVDLKLPALKTKCREFVMEFLHARLKATHTYSFPLFTRKVDL